MCIYWEKISTNKLSDDLQCNGDRTTIYHKIFDKTFWDDAKKIDENHFDVIMINA